MARRGEHGRQGNRRLENILVSVAIPTHDREAMVCQAVASVLGQTHRNLELIVVDDGSTDGTLRALEAVGDPRLKVLPTSNRGVSAARNLALAGASGEYMALLDSDDLWLPEKLERQLAYMVEGDWAVCQTDEIWERRGRRVNPGARHAKQEGFFFERAVDLCLVSPSCAMFTREFWEEVGPFDESLPACEDYDLWLKTLLRRPVGLLPDSLTIKRGGRPDQLSNAVPALDRYRIQVLARLLLEEELTQVQRGAAEKAIREKGRIYVQGCEKRGREDEARETLALVAGVLGEPTPLRTFPVWTPPRP